MNSQLVSSTCSKLSKSLVSRKSMMNYIKSQQSNYSSTKMNLNTMKDFANRYSISAQQHRIKFASALFNAAQYQASNPEWYGIKKVGSDFRPSHAMLSMHVWFLHRRLLAYNTPEDKESGKYGYNLMVQEELFDLFWNDTTARIRSSGVHELTVNKHLKDAQQATFLHCTQYDHAFQEFPDDQKKRFEIVCDAVWRHVLGGDEDVDDDLIRRLGAYVEYQLENIVYKLPDDYFDEGRIAWGNLPDLSPFIGEEIPESNNASAEKADGGEEEATNALSGLKFYDNNWVRVLTDAGEPYYWNTETDKTSWQKPE